MQEKKAFRQFSEFREEERNSPIFSLKLRDPCTGVIGRGRSSPWEARACARVTWQAVYFNTIISVKIGLNLRKPEWEAKAELTGETRAKAW